MQERKMREQTRIKALMTMLMATLIALTLTVPALAAPLPDRGTLVIHKYMLNTTSNLPGTGEVADTLPAGVVPLDGVIFSLYRIGNPVANSPAYPDVPALGDYEIDSVSGNLVVKDSGGNVIGEYLLTAANVPTVTTGNDATPGGYGHGTAIAADLPAGYYFVVESGHVSGGATAHPASGNPYPATINAPCAPFVVAVPMTNPSGDGWLTTVHVYPKNRALSVDKEADVDSIYTVAVGDEITYTIKGDVPGDIANAKSYYLFDEFDEALTYVPDSVNVWKIEGGVETLLEEDTDYTVTYVASTTGSGTSGRVDISFCDDTTHELLSQALVNAQRVKIELVARVNDKIYSKDITVINNEAQLYFQNEDGDPFEAGTGGGGPELYSASIKVTKVDEAGGPLNGASFRIATSEANARAGNFLKLDSDGKLLDLGDAGYAASSVYHEISPANAASFKGLHNYDQVAGAYITYWIVETRSPVGYNKLQNPIAVAFDASIDKEVDFVYELEVDNSRGFVLPMTGGAGIIICTIAGISFLGIALLIALTRRKKADDRS